MAQFKYTALSRSGEKVTGIVDGFNELDAAGRIKESCDVILKLTQVDEKKGPGFLNLEIGGGKLDSKAFTVMCNQFAIILRSGIPAARAVQLIADKTANKPLKAILKKVAQDVESGRAMSASFADHGAKLLPATFIETLRAGEESGNLDRSFETMAAHFDKQTKMRAKVRGALAYPIFVLVIAVVVVIVMMVKVVPTLAAVFESAGAQLPLPTRILIGISNFFQKYILVIIAVVAGIVLLIKLYGNTESGRLNLAKLSLKLPVLGNIVELNGASQFANTMAAMLGAGLPMPKALSITAKTLDNYYLSTETGKLSGRLEEGYSLAPSMREQGVMPDILVDMVGVGEDTGEMEKTLSTVALYYDSELDEATKAALAKLEPALLIFIGVVAGFVVIAMYLAMFNMYDNLGV